VTSNLALADAPGNVRLSKRHSGLGKTSVANVSSLVALDKRARTTLIGELPVAQWRKIRAGIDLVLRES